MVDPVNAINQLSNLQNLPEPDTEKTGETGFADLIEQKINEVNNAQVEADQKMEDLIAGEDISPEKVVLATRKAEMMFQMLTEIRNKLTESFDQLMRIRI